MDVTMPDVDGVEATRRIHQQHPEIRVVMLTMHADQSVIAEAAARWSVGYLVKDCSTDGRRPLCGSRPASRACRRAGHRDARRGPPDRPRLGGRRRRPRGHQAQVEVLQLIADGCSTPRWPTALHKPEDGEEPPGEHLPQARRRDRAGRPQAVRMGIVRLN
ncbi:MAG: response regulator [Acidimicrobiales bacterium]